MIERIITITHSYISGEVKTPLGRFAEGLWEVFSLVNGNPEYENFGIRLSMGLFFSAFLLCVLLLRTKLIYDKKHFVVLAGCIFLMFRFFAMMTLEWGWQIGIYNDPVLHFLSPPLEHFFNMVFISCLAFYSILAYGWHSEILKKIIVMVPLVIVSFFIYSTVAWKTFFYENLPHVSKYKECMSDWQNHAIMATIALFVVVVAIVRYKRYHMFLSAFWTIVLLEHSARTIAFYNNYEPPELATIFHSAGTWGIPILILHFINAYVIRAEIPRDRRMRVKYEERHDNEKCIDCNQPPEWPDGTGEMKL